VLIFSRAIGLPPLEGTDVVSPKPETQRSAGKLAIFLAGVCLHVLMAVAVVIVHRISPV